MIIPARATIFWQESRESREKQILTLANVFAGQDFFSLGNFLHTQKMVNEAGSNKILLLSYPAGMNGQLHNCSSSAIIISLILYFKLSCNCFR